MNVGYYDSTKILEINNERYKAYENPNGVFQTLQNGHKVITPFDLGLEDRLPNGQARDLYDVVEIGDYVAYDAGTWTAEDVENLRKLGIYTDTKEMNASKFSGFDVNTSRNLGVGEVKLNGWRVLKKEVNEKGERSIAIIHAGISEFFCFSNSPKAILALSRRDFSEYVNKQYAICARPINLEDANELKCNICIGINTPYWLCKESGINTTHVMINSRIVIRGFGKYGVSISIELKANLQTTGKNEKGEWELV